MGVYDTLVDGEDSVQVKCLGSFRGEDYPAMRTYNVGDRVLTPEADMTIIVPNYPTGHRYALIKGGRFVGITILLDLTYPPYYDKWGKFLESPREFIDLAQKAVDDAVIWHGVFNIKPYADEFCGDLINLLKDKYNFTIDDIYFGHERYVGFSEFTRDFVDFCFTLAQRRIEVQRQRREKQ